MSHLPTSCDTRYPHESSIIMDSSGTSQRATTIVDNLAGFEHILAQHDRRKVKNAKVTSKHSGSQNKVTGQAVGIQEFYAEYDLKIPLQEKNGKRRQHARAAASLRNKSEDEILDIVENYAGVAKRQNLKNSKKSKAWIANWIEMAETLALGPSLKSKLQHADWLASDFDDPASNSKPGDKRKGVFDGSPGQIASSKRQKLHPAFKSLSTENELLALEEIDGKRKLDNTATPERQQQTVEASAFSDTDNDQEDTIPRNASIPTLAEAKDSPGRGQVEETTGLPSDQVEPAPIERTASSGRLLTFMHEIGMDPLDPEQATKIVPLPHCNEARILTGYHHRSTCHKWTKDTYTLHNIGVPIRSQGTFAPPSTREPVPYLKTGRHGLGGDFAEDPDRATGKGHNYDPVDQKKYEEYMEFRALFHGKYPEYPKLDTGVSVDAKMLEAWRRNEVWYQGFRQKYTGMLGTQWVCGCQKILDEDEGEGESEAE